MNKTLVGTLWVIAATTHLIAAAELDIPGLIATLRSPQSKAVERLAASRTLRASGPSAVSALDRACRETAEEAGNAQSDLAYLGALLSSEIPVSSRPLPGGGRETVSLRSRPSLSDEYRLMSLYGEILGACGISPRVADPRANAAPTPAHASVPTPVDAEQMRRQADAQQARRQEETLRRKTLARQAVESCVFGAFSACGASVVSGEKLSYEPHYFLRSRLADLLRHPPAVAAELLRGWMRDQSWFRATGGPIPQQDLSAGTFEMLQAVLAFYPRVFPAWEDLASLPLPRPVYFLGRSDLVATTASQLFTVNNRLVCESCLGAHSKKINEAYLLSKEWSPWTFEVAQAPPRRNVLRGGGGVGYRNR